MGWTDGLGFVTAPTYSNSNQPNFMFRRSGMVVLIKNGSVWHNKAH